MRGAGAMLATALLAGCGGHTLVVPETVQVPVPVSCAAEHPPRPALPSDRELAALDDFHLPIALYLDRQLRAQYIRELEAVLSGCWQPRAGGT